MIFSNFSQMYKIVKELEASEVANLIEFALVIEAKMLYFASSQQTYRHENWIFLAEIWHVES